QGRPPRPHIPP
uniref:Bradykinin-potentiating peptide 2 n=2 Tax=Gloydius TaxID=51647 RepID=BPP2_GLOHA|nr:RecName: Full=Bradykinin-potentiating peptide 2; Short=AHBPP-2; AltName: Full=Angiotensin-converting enzyme inhibitor 2 [Gloydius halys]